MADAKKVGGVPLAKLTEVYLKIKEERERLSAEYREADGKLVSKQEKIKSALLDYLKENDIKSVRRMLVRFTVRLGRSIGLAIGILCASLFLSMKYLSS